MIFGSVVVLALGGIIIFLVTRPSATPKTRLILAAIADYGSRHIAPNPGAIEDRDRLEEGTEHLFNDVAKFDDLSTGSQMLKGLRDQLGNMEEDQLVMYCSMHGLVVPGNHESASERAVILTLNANGNSLQKPIENMDSDVLLVSDLIDAVKKEPEKKVLFLFDVGRLDPDWRIGHLSNDFSRQIQVELNEAKVENLRIICSSGSNETSWWDSETKQSVFGRFVAEGLAGAADNNPRNHRVDVDELFEFVRSNVAAWSKENRGRTQTVQSFSFGDSDLSFEIVAVTDKPEPNVDDEGTESGAEGEESGSTDEVAAKSGDGGADAEKEAAKKVDPAALEATLEALWTRRDQLRSQHPEHVVPHRWRSVQSYLIRGERQLRGNLLTAAETSFQDVSNLLDGVDASMNATNLFPHVEALKFHSLTIAGFTKTPLEEKVREELLTNLAAIKGTPPEAGKPDPAEEVRKSIVQHRTPAIVEATAWVVDRLKAARSRKDIAALKHVVRERVLGEPLGWPLELFLAQRWSAAADRTSLDWNLDSFGELLTLTGQAETLLLTIGTEALPIAQQTLVSALKELIAAEQWLCRGEELSQRAQPHLDLARKKLGEINSPDGHVRMFAATVQLRDQLLSELPDYASWLSRGAEVADRKVDWPKLIEFAESCENAEAESSWQAGSKLEWPLGTEQPHERQLFELMQATRQLTWMIEKTRTAGKDDSRQARLELFAVARSVRSRWNAFEKDQMAKLETVEQHDEVVVGDQRAIEHALLFPWIDAKRRTRLRKKLQQPPQQVQNQDAAIEREAGVWSGMWGIQTLALADFDSRRTASLWRQWGELVKAIAALPENAAKKASARPGIVKKRVNLAVGLSREWNRMADTLDRVKHDDAALADRLGRIVNGMDLVLTDPKQRSKADETVVKTRRQAFADWVAVQGRAQQASARLFNPNSKLATRIDSLLRDIGRSDDPGSFPAHASITLNGGEQQIQPKSDRQATFSIDLPKVETEGWKLQFGLANASLIWNDKAVEEELLIPVGKRHLDVSVSVPKEFNEMQNAVVALLNENGYPLDIRTIQVMQPFDPNQWEVIFKTADGATLINPKMLGVGRRLYLPPFADQPIELRAVLVTPAGSQPLKAKVIVSRMDLPNLKWEEIAQSSIEVQANTTETPLTIAFPVPKSDPGAKGPVAPPAVNISDGLLFKIEAEGKEPIQYVIQPTFWPADKFVRQGSLKPVFVNQELTVPLYVSDYSEDGNRIDPLLPEKIPIKVHLPSDAISNNWVEDPDLERPGVQIGKMTVLTTKFDKTKRAEYEAEGVKLPLAVSVAGIPRAYRFLISNIESKPISGGQGARIFINVLKPQSGMILLANKDELSLEVAVDAPGFDREGGQWRWDKIGKQWLPNQGRGNWVITSQLVSDGDQFNPQVDGDATRISSSLKRSVALQSLKGGVWTLQPSLSAYPISQARIQQFLKRRGWLRFIAVLTKDGEEIARDSVRFAIDDSEPEAELAGPSGKHDARKPLQLSLQAMDKQSSIRNVVVWLDQNLNEKLDKNEDVFERHYNPLEPGTTRSDTIIIQSALLPRKVEKFVVKATVTNGANIPMTTETEIVLEANSVTAAAAPKTGQLKVTFKNSRGINTVVAIEGAKKEKKATKGTSVDFGELPAGQYKINVVQGRQVVKKGSADAEIKVGKTTFAAVNLVID